MNASLPRVIVVIAALVSVASPGVSQTLRGTVWDTTSEQPVVSAHVVVFNPTGAKMGDTVTNSGGQFTFHLAAPGDYTLLASGMGYSASTATITVSSTFEASVLLLTAPNAVLLDTLIVVGEKGIRYLSEVGFYRRQRMGFGHFVTRADMDKLNPVVMTDVLHGMAGVQVVCRRSRLCDVAMRAGRTMFVRGVCRPTVVLDGVVLRVGGAGNARDLLLDDLLNPFNLEAVEVYPSAAGVPVQYQGYMSPCGAILAWSQR